MTNELARRSPQRRLRPRICAIHHAIAVTSRPYGPITEGVHMKKLPERVMGFDSPRLSKMTKIITRPALLP
jgi:hypothetical protein